jgi:hypothetical protein
MIILLTGCINPNGMSFTTLNNPRERREQYVAAINYYLTNSNYPIVFVENTGTDISEQFTSAIQSGRMEYLSFNGNKEKERGKGYGECEIIQYALEHSKLIHSSKDKRIIKITGRLIIQNISLITKIHTIIFSPKYVICTISNDFTYADSRFVIAQADFYQKFIKHKEMINDTKGYYFEHALCDTIKREAFYSFTPFYIMPQIIGVSGSTGEIYQKKFQTFYSRLSYAKHALYLKNHFNKLYR